MFQVLQSKDGHVTGLSFFFILFFDVLHLSVCLVVINVENPLGAGTQVVKRVFDIIDLIFIC